MIWDRIEDKRAGRRLRERERQQAVPEKRATRTGLPELETDPAGPFHRDDNLVKSIGVCDQ